MKFKPFILLVALTLPVNSCTDAQWRRFQEISSQLANYVNDAIIAINMVKGVVDAFTPAADRGTVSDVYEGIQACNEALQAEAAVVQQSASPLDTPAHMAAAFPRFNAAWASLMHAMHVHGMDSPASGAPGTMMAAHSHIHAPRIVLDSVVAGHG